jgi:hypothetical protein
MIENEVAVIIGKELKTHILKPINSVGDDVHYKTKCGDINITPHMSPTNIQKQKLIGNNDACEKCIMKRIKPWNQ